MENENKSKNSSLQILFNPQSSDYNLFFSNKSTSLTSYYFDIQNDALMVIKKRIESIKFVGLNSLIDFCKNEKMTNLQMIFEWVNFFIYREERENFHPYRSPDSHLIMGISNLIQFLENESVEVESTYGFKYYTSDIRNLLYNLICLLFTNSDLLQFGTEYDKFVNYLLLNIFILNFEEMEKEINEALLSKEKNIPNGTIPFFKIYQEAMKNYRQSLTLNDTVRYLLSTFDNTISSGLQFLSLFIQQKFSTRLNDFLKNKDIPILMKLLYIIRFESKEDLIKDLEKLTHFYTESGLLEGLILTGNSSQSIQLLQNYLDKTDDLILCVILSKFFVDSKESFSKKSEMELFEILNRMKMFNQRIHLNQKLNEIVSHMEKGLKPQVNPNEKKAPFTHLHANIDTAEFILNCFYCNAKIHADKAEQYKNNFFGNQNIDFCPKCAKKLPNCAICLCPIEINIPMTRAKSQLNHYSADTKRDKLESAEIIGPELKYIWCTKCRHGGHLEHIKEWFSDLLVCPVADCNCICLEYNHILV